VRQSSAERTLFWGFDDYHSRSLESAQDYVSRWTDPIHVLNLVKPPNPIATACSAAKLAVCAPSDLVNRRSGNIGALVQSSPNQEVHRSGVGTKIALKPDHSIRTLNDRQDVLRRVCREASVGRRGALSDFDYAGPDSITGSTRIVQIGEGIIPASDPVDSRADALRSLRRWQMGRCKWMEQKDGCERNRITPAPCKGVFALPLRNVKKRRISRLALVVSWCTKVPNTPECWDQAPGFSWSGKLQTSVFWFPNSGEIRARLILTSSLMQPWQPFDS
jgi:hypothetical protein